MSMDITSFLGQSEDELYEQLGKELQKGNFGATGDTPEDNREFGKNWLSNKRKELAELICNDPMIGKLRNSKRSEDIAQLFTVIIDLISTIISGYPAATVSMLIIKEGLHHLCGPIRSNSD